MQGYTSVFWATDGYIVVFIITEIRITRQELMVRTRCASCVCCITSCDISCSLPTRVCRRMMSAVAGQEGQALKLVLVVNLIP